MLDKQLGIAEKGKGVVKYGIVDKVFRGFQNAQVLNNDLKTTWLLEVTYNIGIEKNFVYDKKDSR